MKILLLALANVAAQPAIYSSGTSLAYPAQPVVTVGQPAVAAVPAIPYYGQAAVIPAAAPVYTQTQTTQTTVAAPLRPAPVAAPLRPAPVAAPAAASGPSAFDAYDAQRAYRDDYQLVRGNQVVWNVPWSTLFPNSPAAADGRFDFLTGFAALQKGQWAANNEDRIDDQIRQFRRRNPQPTLENRNKLDDLHLTKDLFHNVKLRRASTLLGATLPGGSGLNNWFERQSHVNEEQLAKNALQDARQAFAKEPSRANEIALRNARDNVDQADYWKDANTYDLLGTRFGGASRLGPIYRTKASGQALETARRQRRVAEEAYAKDPSEENRLKLQMAIVKIRAWEEDDDANRNEILTGSLLGAADSKLKLFGLFGNAINFQGESKWWRRLDRLNRDLIQLQRAKALQGNAQDGPVADRMLALSTYGPNAAKSTHPSNSRDF